MMLSVPNFALTGNETIIRTHIFFHGYLIPCKFIHGYRKLEIFSKQIIELYIYNQRFPKLKMNQRNIVKKQTQQHKILIINRKQQGDSIKYGTRNTSSQSLRVIFFRERILREMTRPKSVVSQGAPPTKATNWLG